MRRNDPDAVTQRGNLAAEQGKFAQAQTKIFGKRSQWMRTGPKPIAAWLGCRQRAPTEQFRNPQQAMADASKLPILPRPKII